MTQVITPTFGTYALSPEREAWRRKADKYQNNRIGRAMISRARKKAMAGEDGPFDVEVSDGVRARLYPKGNRCEKRAFAGVQVWDKPERDALRTAIEKSSHARPFVFLDVGANVGLYSLYAQAYVKASKRESRVISIEPCMETCARLEANIAASGASVEIIRAAISDVPGTGFLSGGENNIGEVKLDKRSDNSEEVVIDTLPRLVRTLGLQYIDAMKVDIEGHDLKALTAFFEDVPKRLYPSLLIAEVETGPHSPLIELCKANGYNEIKRTPLNAVLEKADHGKA